MGQFKFVVVIQLVAGEPIKAVVCPEYASHAVTARWGTQLGVTTRVVEIEPYWAVQILHTETAEDVDG